MSLLAYELLHAGGCVMEQATGSGWSLRRLRVGPADGQPRGPPGRRQTFVIAEHAAADWLRFSGKLTAPD